MTRIAKIVLGVCFVGALAVVISGFVWPEVARRDSSSTIVAALAVIAATISSWTANQIVERENERRRPSVDLYMDFSRYGLVQLVVTNTGEFTAYDVQFEWDVEPKDEGVSPVLPEDEPFSALIPGEKVYRNLGRGLELLPKSTGRINGMARFRDGSGKKYSQELVLDIAKYGRQLDHTNERVTAFYELKKIPSKLDEIRHLLEKSLGE